MINVFPAKAGIQVSNRFFKSRFKAWIPAFAGMTGLIFSTVVWAGSYVFTNASYLSATKKVIAEAKTEAVRQFAGKPDLEKKFRDVSDTLSGLIGETERKRRTKKVTPDTVDQTRDEAFANALNSFKDGLNLMARQSGKSLGDLLPSYDRWTALETSVVSAGIDQRLEAYKTRFGPDSEPINIVELLAGEKFFPGNEAGPSPWEPILRVNAVQITTEGSGVTSSVQAGMNYYFVNHTAPKALQLLGVSNHVGVAAILEYLDDPGVLDFEGRPSFGVVFHLDRKEAGLVWDTADDKIRLTIGYSFQFIPFVM